MDSSNSSFTFAAPAFKTRSEIWTYFKFMADSDGVVVEKKKIACRLCRAIIAYSGNTSNMTYHLERFHTTEFRKYSKKAGPMEENTDEKEEAGLPEPKQLTQSATCKRTAPFLQNSLKYCSLLRATTMQPLSIVDDPAFRNLLQVAEPRFQLPHRTHLTTKVLPESYS